MFRFDRRAWVAVGLTFIYPGLGHAYLRAWLRAAGWVVLSVLVAMALVPPEAVAAVEAGGLEAVVEASANLPAGVTLPILLVRVLTMADAYWLARRARDATAGDEEDGATADCPECGRSLDEELDFCPWCTTRRPAAEADEGA